jgi:hypothetical protein
MVIDCCVWRDDDAVNKRPCRAFHQPEIGGTGKIRLVAYLIKANVLERLYKLVVS